LLASLIDVEPPAPGADESFWEIDRCGREETLHAPVGVGYRNRQHRRVAAGARSQAIKRRQFVAARLAPSREEVNKNDMAARGFQRDVRSCRGRQRKDRLGAAAPALQFGGRGARLQHRKIKNSPRAAERSDCFQT
jgi:hypothetical protein